MRNQSTTILLLGIAMSCARLTAQELPRLRRELDPKTQTYQAQKQLRDLAEAYVSTSPEELGDGLQVGTLDSPGTNEAVAALVADDSDGKYQNLDSLLLWKDGKLIFEMYNRAGRVDGPHYAMSVTKTLTSVTLARAIHLGLLSMDDLDKSIVSFMPQIDRSKIQQGVETITLRHALFMKSGLRFEEKNIAWKLGDRYSRQQYFQKLFESTATVTPATREYKYTGTDPSIIMMIIDIKAQDSKRYASAQDFIAKEVASKFDAVYNWQDQGCGIPKCGAGSNFTSRSLLKIGTAIIQGGRYNGKQILSPEYVNLVMDTSKGQGYFYFFHNRSKGAADGNVNFISGVGAGGQYMATFPNLNIVMVATAHNSKGIGLPLQAALEHLIPLFKQTAPKRSPKE
ncbi:MAG: serine hydrolase [Fuerstiella sp.]|nr:serine hydrolase [Fuerstiella sp.]